MRHDKFARRPKSRRVRPHGGGKRRDVTRNISPATSGWVEGWLRRRPAGLKKYLLRLEVREKTWASLTRGHDYIDVGVIRRGFPGCYFWIGYTYIV